LIAARFPSGGMHIPKQDEKIYPDVGQKFRAHRWSTAMITQVARHTKGSQAMFIRFNMSERIVESVFFLDTD